MTCEHYAGVMGDTGDTGMTGATGLRRIIRKRRAVRRCPGPKGFFYLHCTQCMQKSIKKCITIKCRLAFFANVWNSVTTLGGSALFFNCVTLLPSKDTSHHMWPYTN